MELFSKTVNPLSANPRTWSNTLKQFVGNSPTNCLSVFDHFVILGLKWLTVTSPKVVVWQGSEYASVILARGQTNISEKYFRYFDYTAQKMKFSIKDLFSKCEQVRRKLEN